MSQGPGNPRQPTYTTSREPVQAAKTFRPAAREPREYLAKAPRQTKDPDKALYSIVWQHYLATWLLSLEDLHMQAKSK